ncbi:MAG TPA: cellulose binding domain-containing protein, partial [Allocoleopsis sp.]
DKGFCLKFIIINQSKNDTRNWQLKFTMNQATINKTWNGNFNRQGSQYTVTVPDWARIIKAGQKLDSIGFCASKEGADYLPKQVSATLLLL